MTSTFPDYFLQQDIWREFAFIDGEIACYVDESDLHYLKSKPRVPVDGYENVKSKPEGVIQWYYLLTNQLTDTFNIWNE